MQLTTPPFHALSFEWPTVQVQKKLRSLHPDFQLEVLKEVDSTNTQLLTRLRQGNTTPTLLVAEHQTAGKGRMGKKWEATAGHSLTFSMLIPASLEYMGWLSLVCACALVEALQKNNSTALHQLKIKWPNDLWFQTQENPQWHKLSGILIESASVQQQRYAVIGVGVNVSAHGAKIAYAPPQGFLKDMGSNWDVPTAFLHIAPKLAQAVYNFKKEDIPYWKAVFQRHDLLFQQPLRTSDGIAGVGSGINDQGQLLIETPNNIQAIHSGEVSIRPCSDI